MSFRVRNSDIEIRPVDRMVRPSGGDDLNLGHGIADDLDLYVVQRESCPSPGVVSVIG